MSLINKSIAALFFCLLGACLLSSCGTPGIPLPPSLELPKAVSDLRASRKGNKVYLTWTMPSQTTDRQAIRNRGITRICRSGKTLLAPDVAGKDDCGNEVGTVPPTKTPSVATSGKTNSNPLAKSIESYTDEVSSAGTDISGEFTYAVEVMNDRGRSAGLSNQVRVSAAPALPPPVYFAAKVTAEGVVVSWTPILQPGIVSGLRYLFRIYRREENSKADAIAGELALDAASGARFVDHNISREKRYSYHGTVVTLINRAPGPEAEVEGDDTPQLSVFTHDVFPPAVPSGLEAAFTSEDKHSFIDLIWNPDTESDLAGYNVFRHESGGPPVKINSDLVKLPAFRDLDVSAGSKYYYSVSAVDIRGNESARSEEANETVP